MHIVVPREAKPLRIKSFVVVVKKLIQRNSRVQMAIFDNLLYNFRAWVWEVLDLEMCIRRSAVVRKIFISYLHAETQNLRTTTGR